jgi:excisionase family DNA binding protein
MNEEYLTVKQVAKLLRVHPITVHGWCRLGKVHTIRPGRKWLILASQFTSQLTKLEDAR